MKSISGIALVALLALSMEVATSHSPIATPAQGQARGGRGAIPAVRGRGAAAPDTGNTVTAGDFLIDSPTLINLGFEWFIQGDENRNAAVAVSYRKKGGISLEGCSASAAAQG
ncbi:MAG TPA: hypothetical protein VFY29_09255 [Terriglobia bacterium]|nr:hypothetical protein [Terriglobia bacterium]